jgi:hypothetical protein
MPTTTDLRARRVQLRRSVLICREADRLGCLVPRLVVDVDGCAFRGRGTFKLYAFSGRGTFEICDVLQ